MAINPIQFQAGLSLTELFDRYGTVEHSTNRHLNMCVGPMDSSVLAAKEQARARFNLMDVNTGNVVTATTWLRLILTGCSTMSKPAPLNSARSGLTDECLVALLNPKDWENSRQW